VDSKAVVIKETDQLMLLASRAQPVVGKGRDKDKVVHVLVVQDHAQQVSQDRIKMPPGLRLLLPITLSRTISRFRSRSKPRWLNSVVAVVAIRITVRSTVAINALV
jgi:hypothetical protein